MREDMEVADSEFHKELSVDVVVIDDDESMCEGCRQTLESAGYRTATANNGTSGLLLVACACPVVTVVDLRMPDMSGIEVISRISEIDDRIQSILISGYITIDSLAETLRTGTFDFLRKPFEPERLVEAVGRGMKKRKSLEKQGNRACMEKNQ